MCLKSPLTERMLVSTVFWFPWESIEGLKQILLSQRPSAFTMWKVTIEITFFFF